MRALSLVSVPYGDLLPEILAAFSDDEIARTAAGALARTTAASQRLGYLLEEAGSATPSELANLRPVRAVRLRPLNRPRGPYSTRWRVYRGGLGSRHVHLGPSSRSWPDTSGACASSDGPIGALDRDRLFQIAGCTTRRGTGS